MSPRWWPRRRPWTEPHELAGLFVALAQELGAEGTLHAYLADDQELVLVASHGAPGLAAGPSLHQHPFAPALLDGQPRRFMLLDGATMDRPGSGHAHCYHPILLDGQAVGIAALHRPGRPFTSRDAARVAAWLPLIARELELAVTRDRHARLRQEHEALGSLLRLAHARELQPLHHEAVAQLRHLTRARHVLLIRPEGESHGVTACASAVPPPPEALGPTRWTLREWPTLLSVGARPAGLLLAPVAELDLNPAEEGWLQSLGPIHTLLAVAPEQGNGVLLLLWDQPLSLWIRETRLAQVVAELLAVGERQRRLAEAVRREQALRARHASDKGQAASFLRQLGHDLRNSTFTLSLVSEVIAAHAAEPAQVQRGTAALDRHLAFLEGFVASALETLGGARAATPVPTASLQLALEASLATAGAHYLDLAEDAQVRMPALELGEVLTAMLATARALAPEGERLRVTVAVAEAWATVYVADRGPALPEARHATLLEPSLPLPSLPASLASVQEQVERTGGMLGLASGPAGGRMLFLTLPTGYWCPLSPLVDPGHD